jgi:hypothetical protein
MKKKKLTLASSSSEKLNYVVWLVRSSLQQEGGGTLSFVRVISFRLAVRWGSHGYGLQDTRAALTTLLGEEKFSFPNVISSFYLIAECFFFIFVPLKNETYTIALIWHI